MQNSTRQHRSLSFKQFKGITDTLQAVVIALAITILIYVFIATPNQIDGRSMQPSFYHGELILTNKSIQWVGATPIGRWLGYNYQRGDVIVFQKPGSIDYIKRIIAVPGDEIKIQSSKVILNGSILEEPYLDPSTRTRGGDFLIEGDLLTLGEDEYFAMGDNRDDSQDSRYRAVGVVKRSEIKGRVFFRYWPLSKFGLI